MIYQPDCVFVRKYIKILIMLLVLPHILFSVLNIPFGPSITSFLYIAIFVCLLKYRSFRRFICSKSIMLWLVLILYHYLNGYLKHVPAIRPIDYVHAIKMYSAVCIFGFFLLIDMKRTLKYLVYALFIWLILAFSATGFNSAGRLSGKKVIAVTFGKYSAILCVSIIYYVGVLKRNTRDMMLLCIFPIAVIILSQTRNAFGMIILQFLGFFIGVKFKGRMNIKILIPALIISVSMFGAVNYLIENTALGNRFKDEKSIEYYASKKITTGTIFDKIAGERLVYYVDGFKFFLKNPITGIGINNYQHASGGHYPMHVEYMVHLCEGGIIGFCLFFAYLATIFKNIMRMRYDRPIFILLLSTFVLQLFSSMYSVSFDQEIPVVIYSLLIAAGIKKHNLPQSALATTTV